jgi:OOP family OmpA-OmpF porin
MKVKTLISLVFVVFLGVYLSGCFCFVEEQKTPPPPSPVAKEAPPAPVAKEEPLPVPPAPPVAKGKVMMFDSAALFDFDKADLKPQGKEQIKAYREEVRAEMSRADKIKITGHTDSTGAADYNRKLSLRRAEAVRDYLISLGGDGSKMEVIGAGETSPIADNSTKEGRAKNRRVEVEVIGLMK